jgi:hypothetical protein
MGAGDTVLTVSNVGVFSPDMLPFPLAADVGALQEVVIVTAMNSTKFTVTREKWTERGQKNRKAVGRAEKRTYVFPVSP